MRTGHQRFALGVPAMLIAFSLAFGFASATLAENSISVGVIGGERTAYSSTVRFENVRSADGRTIQIGTATLSIDDASGTNAGWQVAISVVPSEPGGEVSQVVVLAELSAPRRLEGQQIDPQGGPFLSTMSAPGDLRSPRTVLVAEPGYGKGTYQQELTVVRPLPADPDAHGTGVTLTVTITPRR